jgi:hypothetical protein
VSTTVHASVVTLSEAKHLGLLLLALHPRIIRDGKPGLAPKLFRGCVAVRFAQNDGDL